MPWSRCATVGQTACDFVCPQCRQFLSRTFYEASISHHRPRPALHADARHSLDDTDRGNFRGQLRPFGVLPDDRRRHLAILGKIGMGKTTLLQSLIRADIKAG